MWLLRVIPLPLTERINLCYARLIRKFHVLDTGCISLQNDLIYADRGITIHVQIGTIVLRLTLVKFFIPWLSILLNIHMFLLWACCREGILKYVKVSDVRLAHTWCSDSRCLLVIAIDKI